MADQDRRQDQRSIAGKWLDGVRGFIDEKRNEAFNAAKEKVLNGTNTKEKKGNGG